MVKRLLDPAPFCLPEDQRALNQQAADLLTRLSEGVERWKATAREEAAHAEELKADKARLEGERDNWLKRKDVWKEAWRDAQARADKAEAERDALKLTVEMIATSQGEGVVWEWCRDLARATLTGDRT